MAHKRMIDCRIWNDERFRALSDRGKLLWFFLLTHPHQTPLGAMRATLPGLAGELGWSSEAMREAFAEALTEGMIELDEEASCVWLKNFIRYNPPNSTNVVKAWAKCLDFVPECQLKDKAVAALVAFAEGMPEAFRKAFRKAFGKEVRSHAVSEIEIEIENSPPTPPPGGAVSVSRIRTRVGELMEEISGSARRFDPSSPGSRLLDERIAERLSVADGDADLVVADFRHVLERSYADTRYAKRPERWNPATIFRDDQFSKWLEAPVPELPERPSYDCPAELPPEPEEPVPLQEIQAEARAFRQRLGGPEEEVA